MKKAIYKVILNDYDHLYEPLEVTHGWDYICFTDRKMNDSIAWEIRIVKNHIKDPFLLSRWIFTHPHILLPDYNISVMVGARMVPNCNLDVFIEKYLSDYDFAAMRHYKRNCIYDEAEVCKELNKADAGLIDRQIEFYKNLGLIPSYGLIMTGLMIRRHNQSNVIEHNELWWSEIRNHTHRDQLSFNYVLWRHNLVSFNYIPPVLPLDEFIRLEVPHKYYEKPAS